MMSRIKSAFVTVPVAENEIGDDSTGMPGQTVEARLVPGVSPIPGYAPMASHVRIAQTNALTAQELYQQAEKGQLGWP